MTFGEQMNWRNKHLVIILIVAWFIFFKKPMPSLANMEEADLKLAASATDERSSANQMAGWNKYVFLSCRIQVERSCKLHHGMHSWRHLCYQDDNYLKRFDS